MAVGEICRIVGCRLTDIMYEKFLFEGGTPPNDHWFIYLFRVGNDNIYKLGHSGNIKGRIYTARTFASEVEIVSVWQLPTSKSARRTESHLKAHFKANNIVDGRFVSSDRYTLDSNQIKEFEDIVLDHKGKDITSSLDFG